MTKYLDNKGAVVEIVRGLGDCWIVARGRHRVKTQALPPRKVAAACERDLDEYATRKGWPRLLSCADAHVREEAGQEVVRVGGINIPILGTINCGGEPTAETRATTKRILDFLAPKH